MQKLTATSYAILGLLAVRPRSAYDLVRQLQRSNLRLVWPRAESKLYEEPKNLVAHGLATAAAERAGARQRTVYRITPRGRRQLKQWLGEPAAGLLLEFEGLVKVGYGDFGSKEQLLANIRAIRDGAAERAAESLPLVRELAEVGPSAPDRSHVVAIVDRFLVELTETTLRWAKWAEQVVARWPGAAQDEAMSAEARRLLAENARAVEAIASLAAGSEREAKRVRGARAR